MQNAFLGEKEFGIRINLLFASEYGYSLLSRLKILYGHEFPPLAGMDRQRVQIQEACP